MRATGRQRSGEQGAISPEYVASVLIVGSLVAALVSLALPATVAEWGGYAVCRLFGTDECTRPGQLPPMALDEYEPASCDLSTSNYSGSVEGSVLAFDASKGILFARTDRSDGTTAFTVVDDGSLGVSAEIGLEADVAVADVDVGAEAGVSGVAELGSTWLVGTDEADGFQGQLLEEVGEGAVAGAVRLGVEEDRTAGQEDSWSNTTYFQVDLSASGEIGLLTAQAEGEMAFTQILKVTRDLDGTLVGVELVHSVTNAAAVGIGDLSTENLLRGADESSVVQTITVAATTDHEREILEQWLDEGHSPEFATLANQQGQMTILEYDGHEFGLSLGGEVALGVKLGLKGEFDQLDNEITNAWYYGASDTSGVRSPVPFTGCLEALG